MKMTGIGRPLDFDNPFNRAVLFLTLAVTGCGIGFQWILGEGGIQSVLWGLGAGLTVFLAWALGRELDPDHNPSAFLASSLALIGVIIWGIPSLGLLLWLLIAVRIVNRTTGIAASIFDSLFFIGLGAWLSYQGSWIVGLLTTVVLFLDSLLPQGKRRQLILAVVSIGVSTTALAIGKGLETRMNISYDAAGIAVLGMLVFLPVIARSRLIQSTMDQTGERMIPARIQAGQVLAGLFWILISFWGGLNGWISVFPVGGVIIGAGLIYFVCFIKSH
jgi:hypothetical protein